MLLKIFMVTLHKSLKFMGSVYAKIICVTLFRILSYGYKQNEFHV
jgi:hypothetical protein